MVSYLHIVFGNLEFSTHPLINNVLLLSTHRIEHPAAAVCPTILWDANLLVLEAQPLFFLTCQSRAAVSWRCLLAFLVTSCLFLSYVSLMHVFVTKWDVTSISLFQPPPHRLLAPVLLQHTPLSTYHISVCNLGRTNRYEEANIWIIITCGTILRTIIVYIFTV